MITISAGQAALIGLYYAFTNSFLTFNLGFVGFSKPLFGGWLTGVILGDAMTGLLVGAAINVLYIANISAGGSQPADACLAGCAATALAMAMNLPTIPETVAMAIVLATPLAMLGNLRTMAYMTWNSFFTHAFDVQARKANYAGMFMWQAIIPFIIQSTLSFLIVFLGVKAGADALGTLDLASIIPDWVTNGLNTVAGILPAVGICMALNMIFKKNTAPFFFIGFVLTKYLGFSGIILAVLGALMAYIATFGVKEANGGEN